jgi:hypothetical protein
VARRAPRATQTLKPRKIDPKDQKISRIEGGDVAPFEKEIGTLLEWPAL